MRLAESVRSRWFIALASVAFAGSAVALLATCPEPSKQTISVTKSKSKKIGKCRTAARAKRVQTPAVKPRGAQYRDIILAAQPQLDACIADASKDVSYKVTVTVDRSGRAKHVEVKGTSLDLRNVSMRTVGCVETVMEGLTFPTAENENRVSVNLKK